ncbi:MAG: tRNA (adenosine(37)-N6)-threonylcarbamoyltransferase complex dimerization subunit type 1 TsaB [Treponema sp.]|nr:tRNA (adenosine(37)-N6)-threonylcarbamoyltransferase complex dimerization subunit type 1 TsaB [Treponema sp.]
MNLLAIDTACERFSAALACGADTWLFEADAGLRHSELVMGGVDMLVKTASLKPEDLSGVVCMGGPGSFTGLRIGFSLAKGLALSLGIPFAAIPTLECMAKPFSPLPQIIAPVIDAKQGAFFCALFQNGRRLCPDMDAKPEKIAATIAGALSRDTAGGGQALLTGPGARLLYDRLVAAGGSAGKGIIVPEGLRWGNALALLEIARESKVLENGGGDLSSGPEYIRKSDAEIQSAGGLPVIK